MNMYHNMHIFKHKHVSDCSQSTREVAVLMRTALYLRRFKPTAATSQVNLQFGHKQISEILMH